MGWTSDRLHPVPWKLNFKALPNSTFPCVFLLFSLLSLLLILHCFCFPLSYKSPWYTTNSSWNICIWHNYWQSVLMEKINQKKKQHTLFVSIQEIEEMTFITQLAGLTDHIPVGLRLNVIMDSDHAEWGLKWTQRHIQTKGTKYTKMYIALIYTDTTMFCLHTWICDFTDNVLINEIIPQEMDFIMFTILYLKAFSGQRYCFCKNSIFVGFFIQNSFLQK